MDNLCPSVPRLIRFVAEDDKQIYYGSASENLQTAEILTGGNPFYGDSMLTGITKQVEKLLCPVDLDHCRGVICIGLNYRDHAEEAKMALPTTPVVL